MIIFECGPPFQKRFTKRDFGLFKRWMWGWFAITTFPYGINELIEGLGRAGAEVFKKEENI